MSHKPVPPFVPISDERCPAFWFIFQDDTLLLQMSTPLKVPFFEEDDALEWLLLQQRHYLGTYENRHCFAVEVGNGDCAKLPSDFQFISIRQAHELMNNQDLFQCVIKAKQILYWDKSAKYCGTCGSVHQNHDKERAKKCNICNSLSFPHVTPVILSLIWRRDEILLARSSSFMPGIYSILAGFVEPGETLEQTVIRETHEEVGLSIKNLQYYGSQPWPFPSNLMIGFTAEYDSGLLKVDEDELEDAQWFSLENLPMLPKPISLSRQMIDAHLNNYTRKINR